MRTKDAVNILLIFYIILSEDVLKIIAGYQMVFLNAFEQ